MNNRTSEQYHAISQLGMKNCVNDAFCKFLRLTKDYISRNKP